ncbi:MAG TPA: hypothetical protein VFX16_11220 [Pseudonocardiaceae bacterium]|nr:hypothetical protein [Pseudonocardiaceae bacterium]
MTNWGPPPPPPGGPPPGGQPPYGQPYGRQPYGQPPFGQVPYGQPPMQQQPMPQQPMPYGPQQQYGQPMAPYGTPGYGVPRRPVPPAVLFGVSVWRLVIVVFAITGFSLAMASSAGSGALAALSQQASLVTAICYVGLLLYPAFTGGRRHEPTTPWLRGALVVLLTLVSITFMTMLGGGLNDTWSLFEHLLTPLIVLVDWLVVGTDQRNAKWWFPFTWLAFPLAYLLFYIVYVGNGDPIYPFLDPHASDFVGIVFAFLAGVLAFGFVVFGIGKLKGSISTR